MIWVQYNVNILKIKINSIFIYGFRERHANLIIIKYNSKSIELITIELKSTIKIIRYFLKKKEKVLHMTQLKSIILYINSIIMKKSYYKNQ